MAKVKTNAEMLRSIKAYNKVARETKAKIEGFKSAADLILYLEGAIKNGKGNAWYSKPDTTSKGSSKTSKAPAKVTSKGTIHRPIIHVVDIADKSGSMAGGKDSASVKGINAGVESLKQDTAEVDYTHTLCDFADDVAIRHVKTSLAKVTPLKLGTRGSTALFDAIGQTVAKVREGIGSTDKVLVNIYTDGQENASRKFSASQISNLIETLSPLGWTFTFIGTRNDVAYAQGILKIKASNTLVYDGTAKGLEKSLVANTSARACYSQKVSAGEDVSSGFYKDIK